MIDEYFADLLHIYIWLFFAYVTHHLQRKKKNDFSERFLLTLIEIIVDHTESSKNFFRRRFYI